MWYFHLKKYVETKTKSLTVEWIIILLSCVIHKQTDKRKQKQKQNQNQFWFWNKKTKLNMNINFGWIYQNQDKNKLNKQTFGSLFMKFHFSIKKKFQWHSTTDIIFSVIYFPLKKDGWW